MNNTRTFLTSVAILTYILLLLLVQLFVMPLEAQGLPSAENGQDLLKEQLLTIKEKNQAGQFFFQLARIAADQTVMPSNRIIAIEILAATAEKEAFTLLEELLESDDNSAVRLQIYASNIKYFSVVSLVPLIQRYFISETIEVQEYLLLALAETTALLVQQKDEERVSEIPGKEIEALIESVLSFLFETYPDICSERVVKKYFGSIIMTIMDTVMRKHPGMVESDYEQLLLNTIRTSNCPGELVVDALKRIAWYRIEEARSEVIAWLKKEEFGNVAVSNALLQALGKIGTIDDVRLIKEYMRDSQSDRERNIEDNEHILECGKMAITHILRRQSLEDPVFDANTHFERGREFLYCAYYPEALESFNFAISLSPLHKKAYHYRGVVHRICGQTVQAMDDINEAIRIDPGYAAAYNERGLLYHDDYHFVEALEDFNKAIELFSVNPDFFINRGQCFQSMGDLDRTILDYDSAIMLDPNMPGAYTHRGDAYREKKWYDKALKNYELALSLNPLYHTALFGRCLAYIGLKQFDKALDTITSAIRLDPRNESYYFQRGAIYFALKKWESAIKDFSRGIELNPDDKRVYLKRGEAYHRLKKVKQALGDYTETIRLDPYNFLALLERGRIYSLYGYTNKAIEDFSKILTKYPLSRSAFYDRGKTYLKMGRFKKALADFDMTISRDPDYQNVVAKRIKALNKLKESRELQKEHQRIVQGKPGNAQSYWERGCAFASLTDYSHALEDCSQAIMLDPDNIKYYITRAGWLEKNGRYEEAVNDCTEAVRLALGDEQNHRELCSILLSRSSSYLLSLQGSAAAMDSITLIKKEGWADASYFSLIGYLGLKLAGLHDEARSLIEMASLYCDSEGLYYQIVRCLNSEITEVELIDRTLVRNWQTYFHCYLGLDYAFSEKPEEALEYLNWVKDYGERNSLEFNLSLKVLDLLQKETYTMVFPSRDTAEKVGKARARMRKWTEEIETRLQNKRQKHSRFRKQHTDEGGIKFHPVDGADGVPIAVKIKTTFPGVVDSKTINEKTFSLRCVPTGETIEGSLTGSFKTVIFNPYGDLTGNTEYRAVLTGDIALKNGTILETDHIWIFRTEDHSFPQVITTYPIDKDIVEMDTEIFAEFNKDIDPNSCSNSTFLLFTGIRSIIGTVKYDADHRRFIFYPGEILLPNESYRCLITDRLKDKSGNRLEKAFQWVFSTSAEDHRPPEPPGRLVANAVSKTRIQLVWIPSPSLEVNQYSIYWDAGKGIIDYSTPVDIIKGRSKTTWISGPLAHEARYKFGIRARDKDGNEEKNTDIVVSAQAKSYLEVKTGSGDTYRFYVTDD